jgi:hypothetical protein
LCHHNPRRKSHLPSYPNLNHRRKIRKMKIKSKKNLRAPTKKLCLNQRKSQILMIRHLHLLDQKNKLKILLQITQEGHQGEFRKIKSLRRKLKQRLRPRKLKRIKMKKQIRLRSVYLKRSCRKELLVLIPKPRKNMLKKKSNHLKMKVKNQKRNLKRLQLRRLKLKSYIERITRVKRHLKSLLRKLKRKALGADLLKHIKLIHLQV